MPSSMRILGSIGLLCLAAGCSNAGAAPKLATADGTVTYLGKPLAGATVTFVPKKGPLAQAVTDMEGKFVLATGTLPGVAVGPVQVTVSAFPSGQAKSSMPDSLSKVPKTAEESGAFLKSAGDMQQAMAEGKETEVSKAMSLIPDKYLKTETSNLEFTVKADGDNHFKIELQP